MDRILTSLDKLSQKIRTLSDGPEPGPAPRAPAMPPREVARFDRSRIEPRRPTPSTRGETSFELQRAIDQISRRRDELDDTGRERREPPRPVPATAESGLDLLRDELREMRQMLRQPAGDLAGELRDLNARVDVIARSSVDPRTISILREDLSSLREAVLDGLARSPVKSLEARYDEVVRRLDQVRGAIENPRALSDLVQQMTDLRRAIGTMPGERDYQALTSRIDDLARTTETAVEGRGSAFRDLEIQFAALAEAIAGMDRGADFDVVEERLATVAEQVVALERRFAEAGFERLHEQAGRQTAWLSQVAQRVEQIPRLAHEMERQSIAVDGLTQTVDAVPRIAEDVAEVRRATRDGRTETQRQLDVLLEQIQDLGRRVETGITAADPGLADQMAEIAGRIDRIGGSLDTRLADELDRRFEILTASIVESLAAAERRPTSDAGLPDGLVEALGRIESHLAQGAPDTRLAEIEARLAQIDRGLGSLDHLAGPQLALLGEGLMALRRDVAAITSPSTHALEDEVRGLARRIEQLPQQDSDALSRLEAEVRSFARRLDDQGGDRGLEEALSRFEGSLVSLLEDKRAGEGGAGPSASDGEAVAGLQSELARFQAELKLNAAKDRELLLAIGEAVQRLATHELSRQEDLQRRAAPTAPEVPAAELGRDRGDTSRMDAGDQEAWKEIERTLSSSFALGERGAPPAAKPATGIEAEALPRIFSQRDEATARRRPPAGADAPASDTGAPLPGNRPLEPGSGKPARQPVAAEDGDAGGRTRPDSGREPSKADFIAAARRAAQSASAQPEPEKKRAFRRGKPAPAAAAAETPVLASTPDLTADKRDGEQAAPSLLGRLLARRQQIAIAATVLIVAFGATRIVTGFLSGEDAVFPMEAAAPADAETATATGPSATEDVTAPAGVAALPSQPDEAPAATAEVPPAALPDATAMAPEPLGPTGSFGDSPAAPAAGSFTSNRSQAAAEPVPSDVPPPETVGPMALRQAAMEGNREAQFEVAARLTEGRAGAPQDLALAAQWYELSAKAGLPAAQYRLGSLYEKGQGVPRDLATAVGWYERAAEAGNAKAMHNLAVIHAEGGLGEPDYAAAAGWFEKAADYGVRDSQYNLGILFARGLGVPRDLASSYKWFAIAAQAGDSDSAKKRDDVAQVLDKDSLARARLAVETWTQKTPPAAANEAVPVDPAWEVMPERTAAVEALGMVQQAQMLLARRGFDPGPADGQLGKRTRDAIVAFQQAQGLEPTGTVDAQLIQALAEQAI